MEKRVIYKNTVETSKYLVKYVDLDQDLVLTVDLGIEAEVARIRRKDQRKIDLDQTQANQSLSLNRKIELWEKVVKEKF